MNEFEAGLKSARRRQAGFYIGGFAVLLVIGLAVAAALVSTSGTAVRVTPDDAGALARVDMVEGLGLTIGGTVYSVGSPPVVRVRAEGFRESVRAISGAELGQTVEVRLEALPGRLVAMTAPERSETSWRIDGRPVAESASLDLELFAGSYDIEADHPHFEPAGRTVEMQRGQLTDILLDLTPVAGSLSVNSEPAGAAVSIDGREAGTTPLALSLDGGVYDVRVTAPGRQPLDDTLAITNLAPEAARNYILDPLSGTLGVIARPGGGQLLVNGRAADPSKPIELPAGEDHTVTYARAGYFTATRTVRLEPEAREVLTIELEREMGTVEIRTSTGADILVDGEVVGQWQMTLDLMAVPHEIELRKPGHRTVRETITPSAARTTVIDRQLLDETAARFAEAPRTYTNSVGMTLSLFEPGFFTMGAPRSQKGQRANEFEKRVRLVKAFYAAHHEVTNGQFAQFEGGNPGAADVPVTGVTWLEAARFANWLSERENLPPFYRIANGRLTGMNGTSDGYRLLTEAEWEWLARRAGKPEQSLFTWGDSDTVPAGAGNIADETVNGIAPVYVPDYTDGFARVAPVGRFPAEPSGLFDLTGNVSEWVHDFYSLSPPSRGVTLIDPLGPLSGPSHVVKGSNWTSATRTELRASYREGLSSHRNTIGFRIGRYLHGAQTVTTGR